MVPGRRPEGAGRSRGWWWSGRDARFAGAAGAFGVVMAAAILAGCSASADLKPGGGAASRSLYRFDHFQAAADNGQVLVVVGGNGVIVTSTDRGQTWQRQQVGRGAALVGVAACPDGRFAALDFFRQTWLANAQGSGWQAKALPAPERPLAIACDARNRLWVVGSGSTVAMSADAGASWTTQTVGEDVSADASADVMLASIQFVDGEQAFITGEFGTVLATSDGGATWASRTPIGPDFYPYAAHFADARRGWVSGLAGVVMHTEDGGKSWQKRANPLGAPIYGLAADASGPIGVGINGLSFRYQGTQWGLIGVQPGTYLRAVLPLAGGQVLLAGGAGAVQVTTLAGGPAAATSN